ncbi:anaerobic sulfite reductase subunit B [Gottschalkia purinilytica]|uniref:Anaerobic sulfite reductase subunit B n=1 Tax=Gottschalkia purinilytica TaxID=1503 RepID=A0A0L0W884_GOTPU|nr:anaerobic sulfite reductase subunit AsrB [Gottschalkia purinilytica]KNF07662.1 anaerobic sulfite reductase subunit B [Gottschalkia purinilytica]
MDNIYIPKPYKIIKVDRLTDIETLYRVEFDNMSEIKFGQFIQISLPKIGECPISVTDFNVEEGWIEFLIRKVGKVTDQIFNLKARDIMYLRGPYGNGFDFSNYENKNLIIVAGGSGLAPVRSMINYIYKHAGSVKKLDLILGFKDTSSILFKDEIDNWRKKFNTILTVDKGSGIKGEKVGFVTEYISHLSIEEDKSDLEIIIVGPPVMMKYAAIEFEKIKVSDDKIWLSFERKMSCAVGKCGHCKIDEIYVCLDGPIFNYTKGKKLLD